MTIAQNISLCNKKKYCISTVDLHKIIEFRWKDKIYLFDNYFNTYTRLKSSGQQNYNNLKDNIERDLVLKFTDRVGRISQIDLSLGHICIISDNSAANVLLNIEIINSFLKSQKPFEIISGSDFAKLSDTVKLNTRVQYLVKIDINNISYLELSKIISFSKIQFVLKVPGLMLNLKAEIKDEKGFGSIFSIFKEVSNLIKHLVASLNEEEFVIIFENKLIVRSLVI